MNNQKKQLRQNFNKAVLERDGHCCVVCGETKDVVIHHIGDRHDAPAQWYNPDNGITICPRCHRLAEEYHMTDGQYWVLGMHPDDLYAMIESDLRIGENNEH